MIKVLGVLLVTVGTAGAGFGFARAVRGQIRQMVALIAALEYLKSEMEYRLTPLPELFAELAQGEEAAAAAFFGRCAGSMREDRSASPQVVFRGAMEQTKELQWSRRTREAMMNLAFSLGRFDLGGQRRAIELAQERIGQELQEVQAGSRARCRSYETIGICAGLAVAVILL